MGGGVRHGGCLFDCSEKILTQKWGRNIHTHCAMHPTCLKNSSKLLPRLLLLQLPIPALKKNKKKNTHPVDGNEKSSHIGFWNKLEGIKKTPHVKWEVMAETSPQSERFRGFYMPPLLLLLHLLLLPLANPPSTGAYRDNNISFRVLF